MDAPRSVLRIVDGAGILGVTHQRVQKIYKLGRLPEPAALSSRGSDLLPVSARDPQFPADVIETLWLRVLGDVSIAEYGIVTETASVTTTQHWLCKIGTESLEHIHAGRGCRRRVEANRRTDET